MKATGIIRRVDDIGRVVIPKELRRTLKIKEGCPLEIFTYNGAVCFKPYTPIGARDWEKAKRVLNVMLTCGYTLLDYYDGVQAQKITESGHNHDACYEIRADGDIIA